MPASAQPTYSSLQDFCGPVRLLLEKSPETTSNAEKRKELIDHQGVFPFSTSQFDCQLTYLQFIRDRSLEQIVEGRELKGRLFQLQTSVSTFGQEVDSCANHRGAILKDKHFALVKEIEFLGESVKE